MTGGPSPAELARTAVACAHTGVLTCYPRRDRPLVTGVDVADGDAGVLLRLPAASPAALTLSLRPLVTVAVAPERHAPVILQGIVSRRREPDDALVTLELEVRGVRLGGPGRRTVPAGDFRAAAPDPLRAEAPAVLDHLGGAHADELVACLRAQGHRGARWVAPRALDRYGLEVAVVDDEGVRSVRLAFPRPVDDLAMLGPGLALALRERCRGCLLRRRAGGVSDPSQSPQGPLPERPGPDPAG